MRVCVSALVLLMLLSSVSLEASATSPADARAEKRKSRRGAVTAPPRRLKERRGIEPDPESSSRLRTAKPRVRQMRVVMSGCSLSNAHRLRSRLRALQNPGQLMNLEVWGDSKKYVPGQRVYFFFRSPRASYVTLFWLGPTSDVVIPLRNIKIPANQDVRIDSGGIIVPPLGREEWVAINTLEPLHFPCMMGENAVLRRLDGLVKIPFGVGKWVVDSRL